MVEIGYFSFCLALILASFATLCGVIALLKPFAILCEMARNALVGTFLCILMPSLVLWYSLFTHDFSLDYVFKHSAVNMPPGYLFASFWSALEGSHLLWTLILSAICAYSISTISKDNIYYCPILSIVYGVSLAFMLILNLTVSAPLVRLFPSGVFGQGMNALLQNPYMAIHPPMLFTGYSLLIVPFAYSCAAFYYQHMSLSWFTIVRKFSLLAWIFLTVAIFLGGRWAYCELGWGGYWAWDPVENSSFMPWIALTTSLHTFLITKNTQRLPRLALFLVMIAFILTFLGTFMTRSGLMSSIHSFAQSSLGPSYLIWIVLLLLVTIIFVFTKGYELPGAGQSYVWKFSREAVLLFAHFFFLFLLALVLMGTILPLAIEFIKGIKISIQQPFYNAFAPWIAFGLVCAIGIGNLMTWRSGKIKSPFFSLVIPALLASLFTLICAIFKNIDHRSLICYFVLLWSGFILIAGIVLKLKDMQWNALELIKNHRGYMGAQIVHLGFLMCLLGFIGNYSPLSQDLTLDKQQTKQIFGYSITNKGLDYSSSFNKQEIKNKLVLERDNEVNVVEPSRNKFTNNDQWFHEVGIYSTWWHDIYIVLSSFDIHNESVTLKINYNPTVKMVWTSLVVMVIGILIGITHSSKKKPISVSPSQLSSLVLSTFIIFAHISAFMFAFSGHMAAQAESNPIQAPVTSNQVATPSELLNETRYNQLAEKLRCPTCIGISVLESGTPQSQAIKSEIKVFLQQGKNDEEIINAFVQKYGDWILRAPNWKNTYGAMIWGIPIAILFIGPIILGITLKGSLAKKKRKQQTMEKILVEELLASLKDKT